MLEIKTILSPSKQEIAICAGASRLSKRSTGDNGGINDISLLAKLSHAGDEHGKSTRGIFVYAEINAPRYFWQEFVTYSIGCYQLGSESTMHDNARLPINELMSLKEKLPEGTMQKRIFCISFQTLSRIYRQRKNHRLPEWKTFCEWIEDLEYAEIILPEQPKEIK